MNMVSSENQPPAPTNLAIQDLQSLLAVIDLASQRGAFRAPELSQIGALFDRVNQFLQSVAPAAPAATDTPIMQEQPVVQQPVSSAPQMVPSPVMPMTPPFSPKVGA